MTLSTWTVKRIASGVSYGVTPDGSYVAFRPNAPSDASLIFTPEEAKNIFSAEDQIEVYIDGTKVFRGFIDDKGGQVRPGKDTTIRLHAVDWGFYLAGKRNFEKQYWRTSDAETIFTDSAARVTDGTTTLSTTNVAALSTAVKREFFSTQVKDAWLQAGLDGGADYFVHHSRDLYAFEHDSLDLIHSGSGTRYKIVDYKPTQAYEIMVDPNFPYDFYSNVAQRFRSVTATNGIVETLPADPNEAITRTFKDDNIGRSFLPWYLMGVPSLYSPSITPQPPAPVNILTGDDALLVAGSKLPIAQFNVASTATVTRIRMAPGDDSGGSYGMNITPGDYQELRLFIKNNLGTAVTGTVRIRLAQSSLLTDYYDLGIHNDLNGSDWSFLKYDLPTLTSNNGWSKTGTPTTINLMDIQFFTNTGAGTGFTGNIMLAWVHFFRRQRATVTGAGTPATEKIVVDKSLKDVTTLTNFATSEQARVNVVSSRASCVCDGDVNFIFPAYRTDVDFTSTGESDWSGTLRMAEIKHFLQSGRHKMALSYARPYAKV